MKQEITLRQQAKKDFKELLKIVKTYKTYKDVANFLKNGYELMNYSETLFDINYGVICATIKNTYGTAELWKGFEIWNDLKGLYVGLFEIKDINTIKNKYLDTKDY